MIRDFVTIASLGNAQDFGDYTYTGSYKSGLSNQTRATLLVEDNPPPIRMIFIM